MLVGKLLLPSASVNVFSATLIVVSPSILGVKVAVYTEGLVDVKLLIAPPVTLISVSVKSVVASLDVNVNDSAFSLLVCSA